MTNNFCLDNMSDLITTEKGKNVYFSTRLARTSEIYKPPLYIEQTESLLKKMGLKKTIVVFDFHSDRSYSTDFEDKNFCVILTSSIFKQHFSVKVNEFFNKNLDYTNLNTVSLRESDNTYKHVPIESPFTGYNFIFDKRISSVMLSLSIGDLEYCFNQSKERMKLVRSLMIYNCLSAYCEAREITYNKLTLFKDYLDSLILTDEKQIVEKLKIVYDSSINKHLENITENLIIAQRNIEKAIKAYSFYSKETQVLLTQKNSLESQDCKINFSAEWKKLTKSYSALFNKEDETISIFIGKVKIQDVKLGDFQAVINLKKSNITFLPAGENLEVSGRFHPHLNHDGQPCYGNMSRMFLQLMVENKYKQLADLCKLFLFTYSSGNPYIQLSEFAKKQGLPQEQINKISNTLGVSSFNEEEEPTEEDLLSLDEVEFTSTLVTQNIPNVDEEETPSVIS